MPARLQLRAARDRLIDLLGFGDTYPLQDVAVREHLKVPFETLARVPVDPGQTDVIYALHSRDQEPVPDTDPRVGTGGETLLETPPITDDVAYKIFARKTLTGRAAYLHTEVTVEAGLDTSLGARILAEPLAPDDLADTDTRIVDHGTKVDVMVLQSQEGVDYRLVRVDAGVETVLSLERRGDLHDLMLRTKPVHEDFEVRIRATKAFEEPVSDQTELLDIVLPLKVRAARDLATRVEPSATSPFAARPEVVIAGTQASASYRLHLLEVSDGDILYDEPAPGVEVLEVAVEGEDGVRVLRPPSDVAVPDGFFAAGESHSGTGGELRLVLARLDDDIVVVVEARKEHTVSSEPGAATISSSVQLLAASLVLVRPDSDIALALRAPVDAAGLAGSLQVTAGQPGVFYHFHNSDDTIEIGLPAYFHQLASAASDRNKGLEALRIGVDFVITRTASSEPASDPGTVAPPPPLLAVAGLPFTAELRVRAVKARTRVAAELTQAATIGAPPEIRLEQRTLSPGAQARILVIASRVGERYQPFLDGEPVKQARNGNAGDLVFLSDPITEETTFDIHVNEPDRPGLRVTRLVRLTVAVSA